MKNVSLFKKNSSKILPKCPDPVLTKCTKNSSTGAPDILFLVRLSGQREKKDRIFDTTIRYIYIHADLYEF